MNSKRLEQWLQNIYATQAEELSCSECFEQIAHYVEVELTDTAVATRLPLLTQHLQQCTACRQEYETLREVAALEAKGELPSSKSLQNLIS